jgi:hypothetical protein
MKIHWLWTLVRYSLKTVLLPIDSIFLAKNSSFLYQISLLKHFMLNNVISDDSHKFGQHYAYMQFNNFLNCYDVTRGSNYFNLYIKCFHLGTASIHDHDIKTVTSLFFSLILSRESVELNMLTPQSHQACDLFTTYIRPIFLAVVDKS